MTLGPVEYLIIGFPGNKFRGDIAPALSDLIEKKLIRVLDLVFVSKDKKGKVLSFEFDQLAELAPYAASSGEARGLLTPADIDHAAHALAPDSSAALLIWEDLWADDLAASLRAAGGVIVEGARVPHELIESATAALASS